ncbi:MAG: MBL fold metallo-hydrolase [Gammaproteobacteria bacterium]|nr:MAG: MBL fold metallo-hydrolase [Gammaproteobacteria bacterium]
MLKQKIIPVTSYQQNCSLIWCDQTHEAALIDPGGDVPALVAEIENNQLDLKQIWLTHGHLDHVGGTEELATKYHAQIIGPHQDDFFWLDILQQQCAMFNFPEVKNFTPEQWLNEGDSLTLGKEKFTVLHTPGHTPGHIVIVHHASKTVWVGDVLFKRSIGRTDFPKGSHDDLIASIKDKLFALPGDYQFVPGHGPGGYLDDEKMHNPFLN